MNSIQDIKLGISCGDINGVGPEILLKIFSNPHIYNHCTPVYYGTTQSLKYYIDLYEMDNVSYKTIRDTEDCEAGKINVKVVSDQKIQIKPGEASPETGALAVKSLFAAVEDIKNGQIHNLLTMPINKKTVSSDVFSYNGHTDFLGDFFNTQDYMMIMMSDLLKIGMVTGHVALKDVASKLDIDTICHKINILAECLITDFNIQKPKIAVLGLNPHNGDNGLMGKEELEIIAPAIQKYTDSFTMVLGPYSPDGFFGKETYKEFDAVLAMYHDQALIPFKQMSFEDGINYTAGLPIIRTSPDHGTAFDIAGKNMANISSSVEAIFAIKKIYNNRIENYQLKKNTLPYSKHKSEKFSIGVPKLNK